MRNAAAQTGHPQPTEGEVREAFDLFWCTHKRPLPQAPPRRNPAHHRQQEQVEYVPGATVPAVALLAPNGLKATLQPGRARGNLWMLPPPTARNFCPPLLSQDKLTGTPTTCASPPMALPPIPPHTNGPRGLHTHVERASAKDTATIAWGPRAAAEWRFLRGAWDTKHPAITLPVLAKHSTTLEAPAYPVEHGCSQVQD